MHDIELFSRLKYIWLSGWECKSYVYIYALLSSSRVVCWYTQVESFA